MTGYPTWSVVIATHGRPVKLRRCLDGLARMKYPHEAFEVIVVDDGSPIPVSRALAEFHPDGLTPIHVRQENRGPGVARNAGVRRARGRWIAFIDDDCIPHSEWLTELERVLEANPLHLVGGRIVNGYPNSLFDTASWILLEYLYCYLKRTPSAPRFFASMNMGMSRKLFERIGGFDEEHSFLAEDRDLCDRWAHEGLRFAEAPRAIVVHRHGLTLWKFWLQHAKYGRGARQFHLARGARRQRSPRIEPWEFYHGLITWPLRRRASIAWRVGLVGCMILSQVAMLAGYYWDAVMARRTSGSM